MRRSAVCCLLLGCMVMGCGTRKGPRQDPAIIDLLPSAGEHEHIAGGVPDVQSLLYMFARNGQKRQTITLQANSKIPLRRLLIPAQATLTFALAMPFNLGDGAVARVYFRGSDGEHLLFERLLDPARRREDRKWQEVSIDLNAYALKTGEIVLQADGRSGELTGDWIGWGEPKIRIR